MKKSLKYLLLFLIAAFAFVTCNKKEEGTCATGNNKAKLFIKIKDNKNNKIHKARISIFDNYASFQTAVAFKNDPKYAIDFVFSDSTKAVNLFVDPYVEHWILVSYYDSTQSEYLSSELNVSKLNKLESCSDYHFSVILEPVGGTISFWTDSGINLPIKIELNNKIDSLKDSTLIAPINLSNPLYPKQTSFTVKAGTYQYQATSIQGCSWQGEVTVKNGEYLPVKLAPCQRALLAIYYSAGSGIPAGKQTLEVFIDNNPTAIGVLTAPATSVVNSCNLPIPKTNVLYVYLEPGVSHFYKVVSGPGSNATPCIWTGTTPVLSTDCSLNVPIFLGSGCN